MRGLRSPLGCPPISIMRIRPKSGAARGSPICGIPAKFLRYGHIFRFLQRYIFLNRVNILQRILVRSRSECCRIDDRFVLELGGGLFIECPSAFGVILICLVRSSCAIRLVDRSHVWLLQIPTLVLILPPHFPPKRFIWAQLWQIFSSGI